MKSSGVLGSWFLFLAMGCAPALGPTATPSGVLPLRSLRLYETGVGYFERSGTISHSPLAGLPVPAGHLDDALKTLVVLSAGGKAQVDGVEFGSRLSRGMARAMAGLPNTEDETPTTYAALLTSLEGSVVQVRASGRDRVGRLVHVEHAVRVKEEDKDAGAGKKGESPREVPLRLTLLCEGAELIELSGAEVTSVRPIDPAQAARLDAALESLLAKGAQRRHELRLLGEPGAPVTLGYVAETPVWRATYRLVLPAQGGAKLQAWALLHNDTDENWDNVRVDLVNGRPDSFLFPFAAPRYAQRTLVTPETNLSTVPQLMDTTPDLLWGDNLPEGDAVGVSSMGSSSGGSSGSGRGYGTGSGRISSGKSAAGLIGGSSLLEVGDLAAVATASGVEAGSLFVYTMSKAVALRAHASALVPFLLETVQADPVTWIDETEPGTSRTAVRFVNSTSQTLPPGTLALFEAGGFAGESSIDRLKPKERRFLTYGVDLDVEVTKAPPVVSESVKRLSFAGDVLKEHYIETRQTSWSIENRAGKARSVTVALALGRNATVSGADETDYDAHAGKPLIVFNVPARTKVDRAVTSVVAHARGGGLAAVSSEALALLAALPDLAGPDKTTVATASARAKSLEAARGALVVAHADTVRANAELARLREDSKAVGDRGALTQPLVARIVAREDELRSVAVRVAALEKEVVTRTTDLRDALSKLTRE